MKKLIMLSGKPRAGKGFTALFLKHKLISLGYTCRIESFANPLKDIAALYLGVPKFLDEHKSQVFDGYTGRETLRRIGNSIRDKTPDFFTKILFRSIEAFGGITIVDDLRYFQELKDAVKSGYVPFTVRIDSDEKDDNPYESELDEYLFSFSIYNTKGTDYVSRMAGDLLDQVLLFIEGD